MSFDPPIPMDQKFMMWLHEVTQACYKFHYIIPNSRLTEIRKMYDDGMTVTQVIVKLEKEQSNHQKQS